ncbi:hypothetical protein KEM55_000603 [Ascosphaera atra]|nr:hypothetical protein KEM55_000603 [Ascosphaera atra]
MEAEKRAPASDRSLGIDVTEADDRMPESRRFRLQSTPAIVHSRRSTLRRSRFSIGLVVAYSPSSSAGESSWYVSSESL